MPLTTTLVALESISSNYEGWIDFDITNSALKWVGTMECEIIAQKSLIFGLDILKLKSCQEY